jgi:hypothetical protein
MKKTLSFMVVLAVAFIFASQVMARENVYIAQMGKNKASSLLIPRPIMRAQLRLGFPTHTQ